MKKTYYYGFIVIFCFLALACVPQLNKKVNCGVSTYSQNLKTDVAWIVLEFNCRPMGWGSGFLVDKEKGIFRTNKHVSDMFNTLGPGSHKMFFNGKIYNVEIIKTSLLVDTALVRITDSFNSFDFPEPKKFSETKARIGDRVLIEGLHVHPYRIRESDEADGFKFAVIPIFRDIYRISALDLDKEVEVVFERLEAEVTTLDKKIEVEGQGSGTAQNLRSVSNVYIEIKTIKDHKFPFGGLSGTVVRNSKLETLGIFTAGPEQEYDPIAESQDGFVLLKQVHRTAYITPIEAVEDLNSIIK